MFRIEPTDKRLMQALQRKIDQKTKPPGSLGALEQVALKAGLVQQSLSPALEQPAMLIFAADHGIVAEGVSPYPQEVTCQMVLNFIRGGAAINVFCRQHDIDLKVINAGIAGVLPDSSSLIDLSIAPGTENFLHCKAMSSEQAHQALSRGADQVQALHDDGCNVLGLGEMGIGNTSSAAMIMHLMTGIPLVECVGKGTGLDDKGVLHKLNVLQRAANKHVVDHNPLSILSTFGGFEIAMMCGAMLKAAELKMLILVDGFIASSALLIAYGLYPDILDYCIACHQSDEQGHRKTLEYLGLEPLLKLGMRLGEGSGVAVAYPLVYSSLAFMNEMASFEDAAVSQRMDESDKA